MVTVNANGTLVPLKENESLIFGYDKKHTIIGVVVFNDGYIYFLTNSDMESAEFYNNLDELLESYPDIQFSVKP